MLSKTLLKRFGALSSRNFESCGAFLYNNIGNFSTDPKDEDQGKSESRQRQTGPREDIESHFYQKDNVDIQGVQLNLENIRRKQKDFQRETKLPLDKLKINEQHTFYNPKDNPNPTQGVFEFSEDFLARKD